MERPPSGTLINSIVQLHFLHQRSHDLESIRWDPHAPKHGRPHLSHRWNLVSDFSSCGGRVSQLISLFSQGTAHRELWFALHFPSPRAVPPRVGGAPSISGNGTDTCSFPFRNIEALFRSTVGALCQTFFAYRAYGVGKSKIVAGVLGLLVLFVYTVG